MPFSPPAVTVIIPMYRAVSLVAEAIRSIQAQTIPVTFVIAVDDGCPEGSADYVAREFPEVQVLRKPHGGLAETLNHGVQAAKTDWIAFLDHDDRWLPTKMELQRGPGGSPPRSGVTTPCSRREGRASGRKEMPSGN